MGQLSQPERNAVQGADLPENPVPERGGRPANPVTNATVIISQEPEARSRPLRPCPAHLPGPQSRGPCREVYERFPGGPWQILTGVWAQRPALEEHKIRMLQEPAEASCSPEKSQAVRWEK